MRLSTFYLPTKRQAVKRDSVNAYLLERAGYINQVAAGVYTLLPLAVRSIRKIEQIIREEMNKLGASEVIFSALQPQTTWEKSGRWQDKNFREIIYFDPAAKMTLGATHEEPMAATVRTNLKSYRDLPILLYQFQTKFRKELRPKSGLLRGREFRMKDLYSFHPDELSHRKFYQQAADSYRRIFRRLSLPSYRVAASGGVFSGDLSDEFQVLAPTGEDEILIDRRTKTGYNREIEDRIPKKKKQRLERARSIEVGNIFHLGTKYTEAFGVNYLDASGQRCPVYMGSYGIGITRLLGALAEIYYDENGLILPPPVAPFQVALIDLTDSRQGRVLYQALEKAELETLWDDREEAPGVKMVEADLIGLPIRVLNSHKTADQGKVEVKDRRTGRLKLVAKEDLVRYLKKLSLD